MKPRPDGIWVWRRVTEVRITALAMLLLALAACSRSVPKSAAAGGKKAAAPPPQAPALPPPPDSTAPLPPIPSYPQSHRGRLSVVSAGPTGSDPIVRDWPADAGLCETPPRLLVKSEQPAAGGTIFLLHLPEKSRVTEYPVSFVNKGMVSPPAGVIGVQVYSKMGPVAYQGADGTIQLTSLDQTVSGRFGVTLREMTRGYRIRLAGSFQEIPVNHLDSARCTASPTTGTPSH
jgi:hypothetical protein